MSKNKEELLAEAKEKNIEVPEGSTNAEIQDLLDKQTDETTPAEQAEEDVDKSGVQGVTEGSTVNEDAGADEPDAVSDGANDEDQTVAPQVDGIDGVDRDHTPATSEPEEAAAARAGVDETRLNDPMQNREPRNEFEEENQKVTEEERQAAQKVSDMTTKEREDKSPAPSETAKSDALDTVAANEGLATAIAEGFKRSKNDSFELQAEPDVEPRFTLVKNKQTGEVMIRENETGTLSKVQLLSLEEKEASIQNSEVEEL